ncbi:MAG: flagellar basal body-associated protein FliL [Betaproteobacteria bacterium HGW-Betaproteobacteria-6]|jgi:flagellar FliL protein|nr:MAG: flagellar basal body-associated protein FliL [Betaproteobacteria bacterium HGW-Betaproteobacteria-6]
MAKDAKPAEEGAEAPPKKSKKLLIIILAVVLLLVLAGGGAAYMLLKPDHAEDDEETADETAKPAKKKDKEAHPVFINLDAFTVNLVPETGDQYLQVALSLEVEDVAAEPEVKAKMPKIRNNLTLLLSSKKASELLPKEGKEQLAEALKNEINSIVDAPVKKKKGAAETPDGPVKAVLFTSFIIQ